MKTISRLSILIIELLLFAANARAQWNIVAPGLLGLNNPYGAMQFRDGVVWAGCTSLSSSTDSGKTWLSVKNFPPGNITDIAFYDKMTGLVCMNNASGVYLTTDGGKTWVQTLRGINFRKVSFNSSAEVMHALTLDGILYSSIDSGRDWYSRSVGNFTRSFAVANNGTIYVFSSLDTVNTGFYGSISISADLGRTWSSSGQEIDDDSYTLSVDSCDTKRLYLVNEQKAAPTDSIGRIYLSTDGGTTWQTEASHDNRYPNYTYYSGSMTTTHYSVFAGTDSTSGALRSTDNGVTWQSIGGPAINIDSRLIAAINDSIVLAADTTGNIWLTPNCGGNSVPTHPPQVLTVSPASLFATDTVNCDSIVNAVTINRSGCFAPYAGQASIVGPDSASYRIISSSGSYDSVMIISNSAGALNASLVVSLSDGTTDSIPLRGFSSATPYKYSFTPESLFSTDTVECDSITRSVSISRAGCFGDSIASFSIAGPSSASYQILSSDSDSVSVMMISTATGAQNASLLLNLSGGTSDSLPLNGYCKTATWAESSTPNSLFSVDTLLPCDSPRIDTILIDASACRFPNVTSEHISGADSGDYSISRGITQPFSSFDTVIISFAPAVAGSRAGVYEVSLDNGKIISVPLGGYRSLPQPLTLKTANQKTDTIGGMVAVPIEIAGLARPESIDIVLHYDTRLEYENSFDLFGAKLDIPGQWWPGRSELHLPNAMPGDTQGYATFNVWSDTAGQPIVTFDSLTLLSGIAVCEYTLPQPDTSIITPPAGCGVERLSKFVHLGEFLPIFSVQPNPSAGDAEISCDADIGDVTISVYDMLGTERLRVPATITQTSPAYITLPDASGVYYIRIISAAGVRSMNVVVSR